MFGLRVTLAAGVRENIVIETHDQEEGGDDAFERIQIFLAKRRCTFESEISGQKKRLCKQRSDALFASTTVAVHMTFELRTATARIARAFL